MSQPSSRTLFKALAVLATLVVVGLVLWNELRPSGLGEGFAAGNGRIEATEIDVATKSPGRVLEILVDEGVQYVADWVCDDMPFKIELGGGRRILSIPYSFECNDVPAFMYRHYTSAEFEQVIRNQFDTLYKEGAESARVMAIAIHPWQFGQPHRIPYFDSALRYILDHPQVWKATGSEIVDAYLASPQAL